MNYSNKLKRNSDNNFLPFKRGDLLKDFVTSIALTGCNVTLTPIEAMGKLYELQQQVKKELGQ